MLFDRIHLFSCAMTFMIRSELSPEFPVSLKIAVSIIKKQNEFKG